MIYSNAWKKHEHSQREELVVTLVEIIQKGKKLNILKIWKNYFFQVPPFPEAFYNLLLCLHEQGFLLPRRYEYNFQKIHNQRLELRRLKQIYENENTVFYQNELQNISSGTSERSRHLGAASVCDPRPLGGFPLFISDY
jgi:hypothetical protein